MDKIQSLQEIKEINQQIKRKQLGFITNFFFDSVKHSFWIDSGELYAERFNDCTLLVKQSKDFSFLFYVAANVHSLEIALQFYCKNSKETYVVDIVGNEIIMPIKKAFISFGFQEYQLLYRMSRLGLPNINYPLDGNVVNATMNDTAVLKQLLDIYFDSFSEQIPAIEELKQFIEKGSVLIYKKNDIIEGFIISELLGATLYLRYWFVSPEYRNTGIGAKLFNSFMNRGATTRRQLFWVIASNENAIKRYLHYGFVPEKLYDYVLIKRKKDER